jgi:hypothetical protein
MTRVVQFSNNASAALSYPLSASSTTLVLAPGAGAPFPAVDGTGGKYFVATLEDRRLVPPAREIVHVLRRVGEYFTILRGQEGTVAQAFAAGATISVRVTAGVLSGVMSALDSFSGLYVGAFSTPPFQYVDGSPLVPGALYFNLTTKIMFVWDGASWRSFNNVAPTVAGTWVYEGTNGGFLLTGPDRSNVPLAFLAADTSPQVNVFKNGLLLTRGDHYSITRSPDTIVLVAAQQLGDLFNVQYLYPAALMQPAVVDTVKASLTPAFDGVTSVFNVEVFSLGDPLTPGLTTQLTISIDGVVQNPGVDYMVVGGQVHFAAPPRADANYWAVYYRPPGP